MDPEGRVLDEKALRKRIFYGGVEHPLRKEVCILYFCSLYIQYCVCVCVCCVIIFPFGSEVYRAQLYALKVLILRMQVWTLLLGYYGHDSTYAEREYMMRVKKTEYETIKKQWQVYS